MTSRRSPAISAVPLCTAVHSKPRRSKPTLVTVSVAWHAKVDDLAGGEFQRGEQRGGVVSLVVVGALGRHPRTHRQHRLGAFQRLVIALYLHPPEGAVVLCVDEKSPWRGPWPPAGGRWRTPTSRSSTHLSRRRCQIRATWEGAAPPAWRAAATTSGPPRSSGGLSSVCHSTSRTLSSSRPPLDGRGAAALPTWPNPDWSYWQRHFSTLGSDTPTSSQISKPE